MACSGIHCNQCPDHPNYIGPVTPTVWTDDPVDTNDQVKAVHFNELRNAIIAENTRRSKTWAVGSGDPGSVDGDDNILDGTGVEHGWRDLRDQISYLDCGTASCWRPAGVTNVQIADGAEVLATSMNTMRDRVNVLEAECVCNCAYSCTCDCDYCTCDCNHACTCNCNYACVLNWLSDRNVKMEIEYI